MCGGHKQLVGIEIGFGINPKIIFADEPTGNLDTKTTGEVLELMREVAGKEEKTLIMVTHDNTIADFADRKIRIVDGKIN